MGKVPEDTQEDNQDDQGTERKELFDTSRHPREIEPEEHMRCYDDTGSEQARFRLGEDDNAETEYQGSDEHYLDPDVFKLAYQCICGEQADQRIPGSKVRVPSLLGIFVGKCHGGTHPERPTGISDQRIYQCKVVHQRHQEQHHEQRFLDVVRDVKQQEKEAEGISEVNYIGSRLTHVIDEEEIINQHPEEKSGKLEKEDIGLIGDRRKLGGDHQQKGEGKENARKNTAGRPYPERIADKEDNREAIDHHGNPYGIPQIINVAY